MKWLECPKCTFRVEDSRPGRDPYDALWLHVYMQHTTGRGRDRNNSAAAVMQRHKVTTE